MKKIRILLILLVPFISVSQVELKGKVFDESNPIPFANVILKDTSDKIVNGGITDDNGNFLITVKTGVYKLSVSFIGYESFYKEVSIMDNTVLEDIILSEEKNELDEIVIVSKKKIVERKVDRLVFNVENNIGTSGGDALDALSVAPGIAVDDDQITMIGKSGMRVMVDDRIIQLSGEELISFLNSIPAGDIKKIEIITNPPAKYEAGGNAGLINIVYKKGLRDAWNNSTSLTYTQALFPVHVLRNNFTFQKNKTKFLFSLNASLGDIDVDQEAEIFYTDGPWVINTNQKRQSKDLSGRLMFDYELTENSTLGFQYLGKVGDPDVSDTASAEIFNNQNTVDSLLISDGSNDRSLYNHSANIHYRSKLDTLGRSISVDLDYFEYNSDKDRTIVTESVLPNNELLGVNFSANNTTNQNIKNYSGKLDIEHPLQKLNLSYGGKVSILNSKYDTSFFNTITGEPILDPQQSDKFEYDENTQAVYVNASKKLGKKWEGQLGLRLESTQTEGFSRTLNQVNNNDYVQLFPTFYMSYKMNQSNSFSMNYGRRINRPSYSQLNPARFFINSNTFSEGNPFLQPSFTDNFELTHTYKGKSSTGLFFSVEKDGIGVIPSVDNETNNQVINYQNFFTNYNYGLSQFYTFSAFQWWSSQNTLYLINSESEFFNENVNAQVQNGFRFYFATNNTFSLNKSKTIKAQLNYWYSSPFKKNLFDNSESYKLDFILKFSLLQKSLQVSAGVYDIFDTSPRTMISEINGIRQNYVSRPSNRYFRMSLVYSFGNKKIKVRNRKFGNEDEKRRVN
ncbi:TonB-dependent receptor domain-containing protein [Aquimarina latercula]|uniref:TonB-dependent receptor domain-containing protein n=1 Tax=Aquimarina latercula TaxID=987 RepID=UPI000420695B|nr:outer membrane beta-barrel family protein [Aquimarina latercula]